MTSSLTLIRPAARALLPLVVDTKDGRLQPALATAPIVSLQPRSEFRIDDYASTARPNGARKASSASRQAAQLGADKRVRYAGASP